MNKRLVAKTTVTVSSKNGPVRKWVTLGSAFVLPSGQINVILDVLPIRPWDGGFALLDPDTAPESDDP